ncbi:MAG: endonuclease [Flavobacteriaceae bacterium]|nr:endonuclease [Flavobacteriaceae bacterium]|tara:strand:- start:329 stop:871 length:543 start_codon:yes stop_codon:yes gene_type:complete
MENLEIWKSVKNYETLYEVSNLGRVRSLDRTIIRKDGIKSKSYGKLLKPGLSSNGYLTVNLSLNGKVKNRTIHTLVGEAFLNYIKKGYTQVIDHKDNNKLNNRLDNLKILSNRENTSKEIARGESQYVGVHKLKSTSKGIRKVKPINKPWVASIYKNKKKKVIGRFETEYEAHLAYQACL